MQLLEALLEDLEQQAVGQAALRDDQELALQALLGVAHHPAGAEDGVGERQDLPALRMGEDVARGARTAAICSGVICWWT